MEPDAAPVETTMSFPQIMTSTVEQRESPRYRVDAEAWIDMGDGSEARACTLWDISEAGARITIASPSDVPREFSLLLSSEGNIRRRCTVIWRSDEQIGARYVSTPDWSWTS
jgi:hypothetical protein